MKKLLLLYLFLIPFALRAQIITSIAGNGTVTNAGDGGPATAAGVYYPVEGAFDKWGNYYFVEGGVGIARKISSSGIITTFAGNVLPHGTGDGGPATAAELNNPQGIAVDSAGNVYIAETGGNRVRKIDIRTNVISTVVGNGITGYNGDGIAATAAQVSPCSLCFDDTGNMYIADYGNDRVRKVNTSGIISTVTGTGIYTGHGFTEGGLADTVMIQAPSGVCMDGEGNLYIADWYSRVLKVDTAGIITTVAGGSIAASTGDGLPATAASVVPTKLRFDQHSNLFIAEYNYNKVRMVSAATGIITTIAGTGVAGFYGDGGPATAAEMNHPGGLNFDTCGNLYICDTRTYYIRKVIFDPVCAGLPDSVSLGTVGVIAEGNINSYPNPVSNEIYIDNVPVPTTYRMMSIVGATMRQGTLREGNNTLSLGSLPTGIYLLEMIDDEGNKTVKKIIKQ